MPDTPTTQALEPELPELRKQIEQLAEQYDLYSIQDNGRVDGNTLMNFALDVAAIAADRNKREGEPTLFACKRVDGSGYGSWLHSSKEAAERKLSQNGPAAPKYEIVGLVEVASNNKRETTPLTDELLKDLEFAVALAGKTHPGRAEAISRRLAEYRSATPASAGLSAQAVEDLANEVCNGRAINGTYLFKPVTLQKFARALASRLHLPDGWVDKKRLDWLALQPGAALHEPVVMPNTISEARSWLIVNAYGDELGRGDTLRGAIDAAIAAAPMQENPK